MTEQCIDQGVLLMASARMNDKPSRLVDDNEIVVLEQNLERNGLWLSCDLYRWRLGYFDFIAGANRLAWPRGCTVEPNKSGADQLLKSGARVFRELLRQKTIEAKLCIFF